MTAETAAINPVPYRLERIGVVMSPTPGDESEVEGVLNPATARAADGTIRLYARLVGRGNRSQIGSAVVIQDDDGVPIDVRREGITLAPDRSWEHGSDHGGTEDPRITRIDALGLFVMSYVAFGPTGPRPALAISSDLTSWRRLGPVLFTYEDELDTDLNLFPNKDVVFFPEPVRGPNGVLSIAMLHRPMWDLSFVERADDVTLPAGVTDDRPSIWISYVPLDAALADPRALISPSGHRVVATPEFDWESLKIGAGPAPIRVPEGWLLLHHGVTGTMHGSAFLQQTDVHYSVGAMILDANDPSQISARTPTPLMSPSTSEETDGTVANVVFPTAIERVGDIDYVFYGMADSRIGVARLTRDAGATA